MIDLAIPRRVVQLAIHYTAAAPRSDRTNIWQMHSIDFPLVGWMDDLFEREREREGETRLFF